MIRKQARVITCYSVSLCRPNMFIYHIQTPHVITISVFQPFSCAHACFMGIDPSSEYVHLSYAATACNYHVGAPVVQLRSCMFLSCHLVSIPFWMLHPFVIIPSTLFRGLILLNSFSQYGRRAGPHIWIVALHGFVSHQGPEIFDSMLHGIVDRQDGWGMH